MHQRCHVRATSSHITSLVVAYLQDHELVNGLDNGHACLLRRRQVRQHREEVGKKCVFLMSSHGLVLYPAFV